MSIPEVSLASFSNLAGSLLADDLRRLLADPELMGLVLFSDAGGSHLAILPTGPGHRYAALEAVHMDQEIEGLRPICALRLRGAGVENDLRRMTQEAVEKEKRLAASFARLDERERKLDEREARLLQRENALVTRLRSLSAHEAEVPPRLRVTAPVIEAVVKKSN
jgi:hypothetical protein